MLGIIAWAFFMPQCEELLLGSMRKVVTQRGTVEFHGWETKQYRRLPFRELD